MYIAIGGIMARAAENFLGFFCGTSGIIVVIFGIFCLCWCVCIGMV